MYNSDKNKLQIDILIIIALISFTKITNYVM